MNTLSPKAKAAYNAAFRPARTSRLNPYSMRKNPFAEEHVVAPRGAKLHTEAGAAKAYYTTSRADARTTAADMLRRFRKTKQLSAKSSDISRLHQLNAKLDRIVEFRSPHPIIRYSQAQQKAENDLDRRTYRKRGMAIGAAAGAVGGAALTGSKLVSGMRAGRPILPGKAAKVGAVVSGVGALGGAILGHAAGTFLRRKGAR